MGWPPDQNLFCSLIEVIALVCKIAINLGGSPKRQSKAVQSLTIHFFCKLLKQTKGLLLLVGHRALVQDKICGWHHAGVMIAIVLLHPSVACLALILDRHYFR